MSWFDEVTGSNEYERQSWRDSFNGGRAAGDWTGNHNARIESERDAFQGTTWSGSSSQPSALQLAQSFVGQGPAVGSVAAGGFSSSGVGAGTGAVSTAPQVATAGPGRQVVISGGPLEMSQKDKATQIMTGGNIFLPNPWWNDAEEWEARYAEPGEWVGGLALMAADSVFNAGRFVDWASGSRTVAETKGSGAGWSDWLDRQLEGPGHVDAFERQFSTWDRQLHQILNGDKPYVGGGF